MRAIVTVVGKDAVGIIASVCQALAGYNVNILDISQTVMQEYFTMIMMVDISKSTVEFSTLVDSMEKIGAEMGLKIYVMHEDIFNSMHRI